MENKNEDFYDKMKRLAKKTEELMDRQVEKLKKSGTLDKVNDYADKTEDYIEEKVEQFKQSDIPDKVDDFVEKTEKKAGEVIKKAQVAGDKFSEKVEDFFDDIKNRTSKKSEKETKDESDLPKKID